MDVGERQDLITLGLRTEAGAYFDAGFGAGKSTDSTRFHSPA